MDALLDVCYCERLVEIPNILRAKCVPTHNEIKYCTLLDPILETDRVTREELVELFCCKTHQVKAKTIYAEKNDALHNIYAIHTGQNPQFMGMWLKLYVDMNRHQLTRVIHNYLKTKKLTFELW